jgi:hypothetical protein
MTASPLGLSGTAHGYADLVGQPANDRRASPPRRVLPPSLRQEIAAMAAHYLADLGVDDEHRLMSFGARLIERVENRKAAPREDVMLTAFEEMQRLIGEQAGAAGVPVHAEAAGRLGLWLGAREAGTAEPLPLAHPVAPELPEMTPQPLDTWLERAQSLVRRLAGSVFGGSEPAEGPAPIRIDA